MLKPSCTSQAEWSLTSTDPRVSFRSRSVAQTNSELPALDPESTITAFIKEALTARCRLPGRLPAFPKGIRHIFCSSRPSLPFRKCSFSFRKCTFPLSQGATALLAAVDIRAPGGHLAREHHPLSLLIASVQGVRELL